MGFFNFFSKKARPPKIRRARDTLIVLYFTDFSTIFPISAKLFSIFPANAS